MNRSDLKKLTAMRLSDAKALLATRKNNAGAYYVAGYAVECAIKACIAKQRKQYEFPPTKEYVGRCYVHRATTLIDVANLKPLLDAELKANPALQANWALIADWDETKRYDTGVPRSMAENLIKAIEDPQNGVLQWLKQHW